MVEGAANFNWFTKRPIEDASIQNLPAELRAKPWTSELAKAAGPLIGISPVKMEHFVRSMSGGLGANYIFPGIDLALRKAGVLDDIPQPAKDTIERIWGVRAFFSKPPTGYRAKTVNDFFENYQEIGQSDQGWKMLWGAGRIKELDKFLADHPEAMFTRVARKQIAAMAEIKKTRNAIYQSHTLTADQKKERLDVLDDKIVTLARAGNVLMDPEVSRAVKMPARGSLDLKNYYKLVSESVGDAYDGIQKDLPRILRMDEASRQRFLIKAIREAREEYRPVLKKPESQKVKVDYAKSTRKERADWQAIMGFKKAKAGEMTGFRLKEE
jgi:hypothetical protein